jgi:diguanylate cyclase (GGDEF)-like protein/PAS domain S-box-containing protein
MHEPPHDTVPLTGGELLAAVLDAAASLVMVVDDTGRLLSWNRACERLSGYTADELSLEEILKRLVPEDERSTAMGVLDALARGESPATVEVHWRTRGGGLRLIEWSCTALTAADGTVNHVVATGIDVTERRRLERRLRHLADHDDLTGLFSRRRFQEDLERHLAEGRRYGMTGALLVLDLDGFKAVNDTHGHSAGDRVLREVAEALLSRLRGSDIVARLGGDEFAALLPRGGAEAAQQVCQALEREIPAVVRTPDGRGVGVSVGFATFADDVTSVDDVLAAADASMYAVKNGRPGRASSDR